MKTLNFPSYANMCHCQLLYHLIFRLLIIASLSSLIISSDTSTIKNEIRVCNSPACHQIAAQFSRNRNLLVDPCVNYYEYACGSWSINNPIPAYEYSWSKGQAAQYEIYWYIRDILLEDVSKTDIPPVKAMKKLYRSCLDIPKIEKRGIAPIVEILKKTGGWPMAMNSNNSSMMTWQQIDAYYLKLFGTSIFFNVNDDLDTDEPNKFTLMVEPNHELPMTRKITLDGVFQQNDSYMSGIIKVVLSVAKETGQNLNIMDLANDIFDMEFFEFNLLKIIKNDTMSDDDGDPEKITVGELHAWYNALNVTTAKTKVQFSDLIRDIFRTANINVNESESIIVYNKNSFAKMAQLFESVPERVIVNFIQWNMVFSFLSYTTQEMANVKFDMIYADFHLKEYPPRWLSCITNSEMKDAVSYMFLNRYFSDEFLNATSDMILNIQDQLEDSVSHSTKLPKEMIKIMKEKLRSIIKEIGYPVWYKNITAVIEEYQDLQIGDDYFYNEVNYQIAEYKIDLKRLRATIGVRSWFEQPTSINAFYAPDMNVILIPASLLQNTFFEASLPDYVNYGRAGIIMAHELSHSIDNYGILFDKNGRNINWSNDDIKAYENQTICFMDQYSKYELAKRDENGKPLKLNSRLSLTENIADNIGIYSAYRAYKAAQKSRSYELKLPGLPNTMSEDEIFFLSVANTWCSAVTPEYTKYFVNGAHSPPNLRVIGSLVNMQEFADTYKCPVGSPMNPKKKCNLWD